MRTGWLDPIVLILQCCKFAINTISESFKTLEPDWQTGLYSTVK